MATAHHHDALLEVSEFKLSIWVCAMKIFEGNWEPVNQAKPVQPQESYLMMKGHRNIFGAIAADKKLGVQRS
jgi:hypothetical protein